jgi:NAD(P)-dependent dehydrogenase (short-subunit alcohol dehydrogenase family)
MQDVTGKVAVITGGASGIGKATAERLAAKGAKLVLADIEAPALEATVAEFAANGASVTGVVTDVADLSSVEALRDAALDAFGAVHIVFNNAGVGGGTTITSTPAAWDWVLGVNVDGVAYGMATFLPLLLAQDEGHIVNTASLAGLGGVPGMGPYCASKFAVVGMSESLFYELALIKSNVHCSVLCPGFTKTRIHESDRNMPADLAALGRDPMTEQAASLAKQAVENGIEVSIVADAVVDAIGDERFWILTHERVALATMRQRLAWMEGGRPPRIDLDEAGRA